MKGRLTLLLFLSSAEVLNEARAQPASPNHTSALGSNVHMFKEWVSELSVVDVFKMSNAWVPQCDPTWPTEPDCTMANSTDTGEAALLDLDEHGWIRSLPSREDAPVYWMVSTAMVTGVPGHFPGGQYVVLYEGEGTIEYLAAATKNLALSQPGRDVIDVDPLGLGIQLRITETDPFGTGNYLRNIRVIMPGFESNYESQVFYPPFLEKLERFSTIRFAQWQEIQGSQQVDWIDRTVPTDARYNRRFAGVPYELMIDLCNRLRADIWLNMPHLATDDYLQELAALVKERLDPALHVYIEHSNEIWNDAPGFPQGRQIEARAVELWPDPTITPYEKRFNYHGMRTAQICDLWKGVFDEEDERVKCIAGGWAASSVVGAEVLDCPMWTEGAPCSAHGIDALAIAPYINLPLGDASIRAQLEVLAQEPDAVDRFFDQMFFGGVITGAFPGGMIFHTKEMTRYNSIVASARGVDLYAYEGGTDLQSPIPDPLVTELFFEAVVDPRMGVAYEEYLEGWRDNGGKLFVHYANVARNDVNGSVGALQYIDQVSSPKYDALMSFIDEHPCWWGCRCGDGVIDAGETCDDSNRASGDCCSSTCQLECGPQLDALSPNAVVAGAPETTVTLQGSWFAPGARATFDGAELETTFISSQSLSAVIPASSLATVTYRSLAVVNPAPSEGTSQAQTFTVGHAVPAITSLSPNTGPAGGGGGVVNVYGTGFIASSQLRWNGVALATTYISATQLRTTISSAQLVAGEHQVTVFTPAPGGGSSAPRVFTAISNPLPVLTAISPPSANVGTAAVTLVLTGSSFIPSSSVMWNNVALPTTYVSSTQLSATVGAQRLAAVGTANVNVFNPAPMGGLSAARVFTVHHPAPVLSSVAPSSVLRGSAATTVTLAGASFVNGAQATLGTTALTTTYVSATQLTATVPESMLAGAASSLITIANPSPSAAPSAPLAFEVANPLPALANVSPSWVLIGSADQTITLTGSGFIPESQVSFGGADLATTFVSANTLQVTLAAATLATAAVHSFAVINAAPGGGTSGAMSFSADNPVPVLTTSLPYGVTGSAGGWATFTGASFVPSSYVTFAGVPLQTTYVSSTQLSARITSVQLAIAGTYEVRVVTPGPGGGNSNARNFIVGNNPPAAVTALSPSSIARGSPSFTLTITGTSFLAGGGVRFGNLTLPATYVSATQVTATIPASAVTTAGNYTVSVVNPGPAGGSSTTRVFTVNP